MSEIIVPADTKHLETVMEFIETQLNKYDVSEDAAFQLKVATEEIFVNIARYAYGNAAGEASVSIKSLENPFRVIVKFSDSGVPFNPLGNNPPDTTLSAAEREIGGLGIHIVRTQMDNVEYEYKDGRNIITISKKTGRV